MAGDFAGRVFALVDTTDAAGFTDCSRSRGACGSPTTSR